MTGVTHHIYNLLILNRRKDEILLKYQSLFIQKFYHLIFGINMKEVYVKFISNLTALDEEYPGFLLSFSEKNFHVLNES